MEKVLKVKGMSCGHCVNSIESSVSEIEGVTSVKVDLSKEEVAIEYKEEAILGKIKEEIEDQGYAIV